MKYLVKLYYKDRKDPKLSREHFRMFLSEIETSQTWTTEDFVVDLEMAEKIFKLTLEEDLSDLEAISIVKMSHYTPLAEVSVVKFKKVK